MTAHDPAARALNDLAHDAAEAFKNRYLESQPFVTPHAFIEAKSIQLRIYYRVEQIEFDSNFLNRFDALLRGIDGPEGLYRVEALMDAWVDAEAVPEPQPPGA